MRMSQSVSRTSSFEMSVGAREPLDRPVLLLPGDDPLDVESVGVVDAAGRIGDGDHRGALGVDERGGDRAGVAEALDGDAGLRQLQAEVASRLDDAEHRPAGRRLVATLRPAQADRLAGDDARDRVPGVHGVGVHEPGHHLGVRVHVRRGNVALRPDEDLDLGEEATAERLQLLLAQLLRIDDHATLAAAVGDADDRTLPGHPHREGLDLVDADVLVVADPALRRAAAQVVLDAEPREHLDRAVVHLHREVDRQLPARLAEHAAQAGIQVEALGGEVELLLSDLPRVDGRGDLLDRHG